MTPRAVFRTLVMARNRFRGHPTTPDYANGMWGLAGKEITETCEALSEKPGSEPELEFLAGVCVLQGGNFWENVKKNCGKKSPHSFAEELFSRTKNDSENLRRLMKTLNRNERELLRRPTGGTSIARALLESLAISPWCYILHFDVADGSLSTDEVKTNNIVKEMCKCRETS